MRNSGRLRGIRARLGRRSASSAQCRAARRSCGAWIRNASRGHLADGTTGRAREGAGLGRRVLGQCPRSRSHRARLGLKACWPPTGRATSLSAAPAAIARSSTARTSSPGAASESASSAEVAVRPCPRLALSPPDSRSSLDDDRARRPALGRRSLPPDEAVARLAGCETHGAPPRRKGVRHFAPVALAST